MTKLIGLAGPAGAGKDTVGEMFRTFFGWRVFAFSDELYSQVSEAFGIPVSELKERKTKEKPARELSLWCCADSLAWQFILPAATEHDRKSWKAKIPLLRDVYLSVGCVLNRSRSPREILQWWGTDYRRAQNPSYWLERAQEALDAGVMLRLPGMVNTDTRFADEADWIRRNGGVVVHVDRPDCRPANDHIAERPLERWDGDLTLPNTGSLADLSSEVRRLEGHLRGRETANA